MSNSAIWVWFISTVCVARLFLLFRFGLWLLLIVLLLPNFLILFENSIFIHNSFGAILDFFTFQVTYQKFAYDENKKKNT